MTHLGFRELTQAERRLARRRLLYALLRLPLRLYDWWFRRPERLLMLPGVVLVVGWSVCWWVNR